jgi:hypothetical protein
MGVRVDEIGKIGGVGEVGGVSQSISDFVYCSPCPPFKADA